MVEAQDGSTRSENWSEEEKRILGLNYGRTSKRKLQNSLPKRKWNAIRKRAVRSKLSYYQNGQGETVQSLAEKTDIKPSTIKKRLKKGQIAGAKKVDGRKWDITSGTAEMTWNGNELHRQDPNFLNRADKERCYSCNNFIIQFHGTGLDDWCSRRCFQDYKYYATRERAYGQPNPMFIYSPYLRPNFQDWMLKEGFWTRLPWVPSNYAFPTEADRSVSDLEKQIKWVFATNVGRVLNLATMRAILTLDAEKYGLFIDPATQQVQVEAPDVDNFVDKLKVKDAVTPIKGGGWGIGIYSPYDMTEIVLIRQLQQKNRGFVRMDHLALNISEQLPQERELDLGQVVGSVSDKLEQRSWEVLYRRTVGSYGGQGYVALMPRQAT
jgi:hypothetical protein